MNPNNVIHMKLLSWELPDRYNELYTDNILMRSYIYCCLYYFYYGKAFNGITSFSPQLNLQYDIMFYVLDKIYNVANPSADAIRLDKKLHSFIFCNGNNSIVYYVRESHKNKINLNLDIRDMPECIRDFAIKYEKELYW